METLQQAEQAKQAQMPKTSLIILGVFVIAIFSIVGYIFILPMFIQKPTIEKPTLTTEQTVQSTHVEWVANELSAYKLKPALTGEPPEIEVVITDIGQIFTVTIKDNKPAATLGAASNPDIRIKTDRQSFAALYTATDFNKEVISLYNQGKLQIELVKDQPTLLAKGYLDIYNAIYK